MVCKNCLCVYEKEGECALGEITINDMGMCNNCAPVQIPEPTLQREKKKPFVSFDNGKKKPVIHRKSQVLFVY